MDALLNVKHYSAEAMYACKHEHWAIKFYDKLC